VFNRQKIAHPKYPDYSTGNKMKVWYFYSRPTDEQAGTYKLHISIDPTRFLEVADAIHDVLHNAIRKKIILSYKTLDVVYMTEIIKNTKQANNPPNLRQANNPFVLYLTDSFQDDDYYLSRVVELCMKIENILRGIRPGNNAYLAECDLPLLPHFIFRKAKLNGTYIRSDNKAHTEQLKIEAENSVTYHKLTQFADLLKIKTLRINFLDHAANLKHALDMFENKLISQSVIPDKLLEVAKQIREIQKLIAQVKKVKAEEYKDYPSAKSIFQENFNFLNKIKSYLACAEEKPANVSTSGMFGVQPQSESLKPSGPTPAISPKLF